MKHIPKEQVVETMKTLAAYWAATPNATWRLITALAVFLVMLVASRVVRSKTLPWLLRRAEKRPGKAMFVLMRGFSKPTPVLLWVIGLYIAVRTLPLPLSWMMLMAPWLAKGMRIVLICLLAWGLVGSSDLAPLLMHNVQGRLDVAMDRTAAAFLNKILKILVLAFAVVMVLGELNFNVDGLITGMGLAGLTVSLAAKESATNFFSGLVIIMEKPFALGDWISVGTVEGTVEDIGFRSTKVRTLDGSQVVVPNTTICSQTLINGTQRTKRLFRFTLGVTYSTPRSSIEQLLQALRELLTAHAGVDPESVTVRMEGFGPSSIDILVHCYVLHPDLAGFLQVREELELQILSLMEQLGIDFAFPSQSIYIEKQ